MEILVKNVNQNMVDIGVMDFQIIKEIYMEKIEELDNMNCDECEINGVMRLMVCEDCNKGKNFYRIFKEKL